MHADGLLHGPLPPALPPRSQRLIGKEVAVSMEYNRKVQPLEGGRPGDAREMAFGTVTITEGSGAEQKVGRVAAGWAGGWAG